MSGREAGGGERVYPWTLEDAKPVYPYNLTDGLGEWLTPSSQEADGR